MRDGLLPIVAVAGAISVSVIWTLSANDPYWRLFDSDAAAAPAYSRLVATEQAIDSGPAKDPMAFAPRHLPALAVVNRVAATLGEPSIVAEPLRDPAMPGPPQRLRHQAALPLEDQALPRAAMAARAGIDEATDVAIALAPLPLPSPLGADDELLMSADDLGVTGSSAPDVAQLAPLPPHFAASESSEDALALTLRERRDVQHRLSLAGFDPNGIDGVFGMQTRAAIRDYQSEAGFPATGYLEPAVYGDLMQRTEAAERERRRAALAWGSAPELAPVAAERGSGEDLREGQCARDIQGRIIERQSLKCDLAGFSETFVSFGGGSGSQANSAADLDIRVADR